MVPPEYPVGMTEPAQRYRKLSISVPEDVADRLEREPNASAFVADAVRTRMRLEELSSLSAEAGMTITREGVARARARRLAVEAEWTPERFAGAREETRRAAESAFIGPGSPRGSAA
jgi:hypothetical protein